ncbi:hypothetical protein B7463_g2682, partial [Scytalidium lignicola]
MGVLEEFSIPRGWIRLLVVQPANFTDEINCRLLCLSLHDISHSYEALSYTWMGASFSKHICLEGYQFSVTPNVEAALRYLREDKQPRTLWVDSVCIDQSNILEKSYQVQQMKEVYERAERVLVWIGQDIENEDFKEGNWVESGLRAGVNGISGTKHAFGLALKFGMASRSGDRAILEHNYSSEEVETWASLARLLKRSYFRRVWVIQEVAVAKEVKVICGRHRIQWSILFSAYDAIVENRRLHNDNLTLHRFDRGIGGMDVCRRMLKNDRTVHDRDGPSKEQRYGTRFLKLLTEARSRDTTDPRDRIYSVIGIGLTGEEPFSIDIDYNKSILEVYVDVVRFSIATTKKLSILYACDQNHHSDFPSWVPNWGQDWIVRGSQLAITAALLGHPNADIGTGAGRYDADARISEDLRILNVRGFCADQIMLTVKPLDVSSLGPEIDGAHFVMHLNLTLVQYLRDLERLYLAMETQYGPNEQAKRGPERDEERREELLWAIKVCCWGLPDFESLEGLKEWYYNYVHSEWEGGVVPPIEYQEEEVFMLEVVKVWKYVTVISRSLLEYNFFISKKGYLGSVHRSCNPREGDKVCVLLGGALPFLLRQDQTRYCLLGTCYMSNTFLGSLTERFEDEQTKVEEFQLQ